MTSEEQTMTGKVLVSPSELSDMMKAEPAVLIDTRDPATYAKAHIPGAVDMREVFTYLATSTPEGMAALRDRFAAAFGKAGLSGAETAVIYEQSMSTGFGQSCRGYVLLRYLGYPKVRVLHGGYAAWVAAGLPSTTTVPAPAGNAHFGRLGDDEIGR
jgi:thiosulfate/3-mercaptopyruvate sulfurtransferase